MFHLTTHSTHGVGPMVKDHSASDREPLLIGKCSPCGDSGFLLSLSEWSFNILCPTPYNRKYNVLSASLNKTFPSFLLKVHCLLRIQVTCFKRMTHHHSTLCKLMHMWQNVHIDVKKTPYSLFVLKSPISRFSWQSLITIINC